MEVRGHNGRQNSSNEHSAFIRYQVFVVLVGVVCYLTYLNLQLKGQIQVIKNQKVRIEESSSITTKTRELDEMALAYERMRIELEELGVVSDSLNKKIDYLNEFIAEVRKGNGKAISHIKDMMEKVRMELEREDYAIIELRHKQASLAGTRKYSMKKVAALKEPQDYIRVTRKELEEKIATASLLKAENIRVVAINRFGKEVYGVQHKASGVRTLRVTFSLARNIVARKDRKHLVMRMIDPAGTVLYDLFKGGGFFYAGGKELAYTEKQTLLFDNTNQTVTFLFRKGGNYKKGTYLIELYSDGHKIGETDFEIL